MPHTGVEPMDSVRTPTVHGPALVLGEDGKIRTTPVFAMLDSWESPVVATHPVTGQPGLVFPMRDRPLMFAPFTPDNPFVFGQPIPWSTPEADAPHIVTSQK